MLAALLLNLPDYLKQPDADAGIVKKARRRVELPEGVPITVDDVIAAADELEAVIEQEESLKKLPEKVRDYVSTNVLSVDDISNLQAELAMREFEYRQRLQEGKQQEVTLLILEQISVILRFVQDDEEAILALLLS